MPEHFSKKTAAAAVSLSDAQTWPTGNLYPAVFLLTPEQVAIVEPCVHVRATNVILSKCTFALAKQQCVVDDEDDDGTQRVDNMFFINGSTVGTLYMVCLRIIVSETKAWPVHMDHVHLYTPMSRL